LLIDHGRWFSPGTPASSTTKTGRYDITEILLKVALNTINQSIQLYRCDSILVWPFELYLLRWWRSYGCCIYNYLYIYNQRLSPLKLWVQIPLMPDLYSIQHYPGTLVSSTNKTDRHVIAEILLKVALNTITLTMYPFNVRKMITVTVIGLKNYNIFTSV
jgi:hypothetical protein